uniref:Uncharacterized protein n=1 Tax=uncultured marine virus TaxID=186617 RepID=A0A0F7L285_9VIRU|nr:hypothetical protein [uncultured marine virus]
MSVLLTLFISMAAFQVIQATGPTIPIATPASSRVMSLRFICSIIFFHRRGSLALHVGDS